MKRLLAVLVWLAGSTAAFAQVNVNGATVDASVGFTYQHGATNGQVLCGNGTRFVPSATCGTAVTLYYQSVQLNGASRPQRSSLNFSANFTATDDGGSNRTNVDLASTISSDTTGNAATATNATNAVNATNATTATALASTPSQCGGGTPLATGIAANGNANCTTATVNVAGSIANVTGQTIGTTYTNSNAYMIYVSGYFLTTGSGFVQLTCTVNGSVVSANQFGATTAAYPAGFACMVPAGATYVIGSAGSATLSSGGWYETAVH